MGGGDAGRRRRVERGTTEKRPPAAEPSDAEEGSAEREQAETWPSAGKDAEPAAPGDLGRYQILFELARGGMGTVHVGRLRGAHGFDRLVAIKKLRTKSGTDEDLLAFLGEARLSAKIHHPNVVQTLELGEHEGVPFLVMELIEGVSLAHLQRQLDERDERLDPMLAAWIAAQAATGLHAAHELCSVDGEHYGLVHRDVSPENVLLSFDGRVSVADFGVAQFTDAERRTRSGVVKGKFAYMSPEQTEAKALDRRSDIFSLGIVLHECLTGEPLFEGRNVPDTIRRIWTVDAVDPSEAHDQVPKALGPIVLRCLEKESDDRYATADEVARELRQLLRESDARVDEAELSELLAQHFPERRESLRQQIRQAVRRAETGEAASEVAIEQAADPERQTGRGSVAASVTTGPPLHPRRLSGAVVLIGLVAIAALLVVLLGRDDDGEHPATPQTSTARAETAPPSEALDPTTSASLAPPDEPAALDDPPDAAPVATTAPPRPPRPPAAAPTAPPATAAPTATSAPSATTDHKGVPFRSLDP